MVAALTIEWVWALNENQFKTTEKCLPVDYNIKSLWILA